MLVNTSGLNSIRFHYSTCKYMVKFLYWILRRWNAIYFLKPWIAEATWYSDLDRILANFFLNQFQKRKGAAVSFSKFSVCHSRIIWSVNFSRRIRILTNVSGITRWSRRQGEPRNRVSGTKFYHLNSSVRCFSHGLFHCVCLIFSVLIKFFF